MSPLPIIQSGLNFELPPLSGYGNDAPVYPKLVVAEEVDTSKPIAFSKGCVFNVPVTITNDVVVKPDTVFNEPVIITGDNNFVSAIFNAPVVCEGSAKFFSGTVFNSDVTFNGNVVLDGVVFTESSNADFRGNAEIGSVTQEGRLFEFPVNGKSRIFMPNDRPMLLTHMTYGGERLLFKYPFKLHCNDGYIGFIWYFADSGKVMFEYRGMFADQSNAAQMLKRITVYPEVKSVADGFCERIVEHRANLTGVLDVGFVVGKRFSDGKLPKYCLFDSNDGGYILIPTIAGGENYPNITLDDSRMLGSYADYVIKSDSITRDLIKKSAFSGVDNILNLVNTVDRKVYDKPTTMHSGIIGVEDVCVFSAPVVVESGVTFNKGIIINDTAEFGERCTVRSIISNNHIVNLPLRTYIDGALNKYQNVTIDDYNLQYSSHILWDTDDMKCNLNYDPINHLLITDDGVLFTVIREFYDDDEDNDVVKYDMKGYFDWLNSIVDASVVRTIKLNLKKFFDAFAKNDFSDIADMIYDDHIDLTPPVKIRY